MLALLSVAHFWNDTYSTVYPALVPLFMGLLHWSVTAAGLVGAVGSVMQGAQPFLGRMVDARPNRFYTGGALLAASLTALLEPLSRNYVLFLVLLLLGTTASSVFHPNSLALVGRSQEGRGRRIAAFLVAGNVGRAAGPLMASVLALWLGGIDGVAVIAIPGIALALYAMWATPAVRAAPRVDRTPVLSLLLSRARRLSLLLGLAGTRSMVTFGLTALLPVWVHQRGGIALESSIYLAVLLFVGSFGNGVGGWMSDRFPRRTVLMIGAVGAAVMLFLFVSTTGAVAVVVLALVGLFSQSSTSVTMVMGQELFPESRGMASGIALGLGNAFGAVLVAGLSLVAGHWGIPDAFYVAATASLVGVPLALAYGEAPRVA